MTAPQLLLYNAFGSTPSSDPGFIMDLSGTAKDWSRSIRLNGGYWQGSFKVEGDLQDLTDWFYKRLGCHLVERSGGVVTWEGMIYELELLSGGIRRRRSLDTLANAVMITCLDPTGDTDTLDYATAANSITRYGRKEEMLSIQGLEAEAVAMRARVLKERCWANAEPVSVSQSKGAAVLEVTVAGYAHTMNWQYIDNRNYADKDSTVALSTWIAELITAYCPFITAQLIRTNTTTHSKYLDGRVRCWDFLQELVALGDADNDPWRIFVGAGRRAVYEEVPSTPSYYLRADGIFNQAGGDTAANPYRVLPGVFRDLQYPIRRSEQGAWLTDARDVLVEEVEADAEGKLSLRAKNTSESALLAAQDEANAKRAGMLDEYWRQAMSVDQARREASWAAANQGVTPMPPMPPGWGLGF